MGLGRSSADNLPSPTSAGHSSTPVARLHGRLVVSTGAARPDAKIKANSEGRAKPHSEGPPFPPLLEGCENADPDQYNRGEI
jgi:hypothetical protein